MKSSFSFKVMKKGVIINLEPNVEFSRLKDSLLKHVNEASNFFAGIDIYINLQNNSFELSQLRTLMEIVEKYNKVQKIYFYCEEESSKPEIKMSKDTVLIRRTIRSGQRIKYPTNIVILGDINPGAEVIAGGDIIVLGRLRGVVHAGANGISEAEVIALTLEPTQLRIGNIISRPPDKDSSSNRTPEKAFIKNNNIIVEKLHI